MTRADRQSNSIKNKYAECNKGKQSMGIAEYIEKKQFRQNCTWTLLEGQMFVTVNGVLLKEEDFNKLHPEPIVPHFNHDTTNIDTTRKWMY